MTQADALLAKAFASDLPPARDPDFTLGVMARMARRQCILDLVGTGVFAAISALVLWALWPVLAKALDPVVFDVWQTVAPAAAAVTVALTVIAFVMTAGRPERRLEV
jgi:NADH:ubiquinone oxidoreductase subunit K